MESDQSAIAGDPDLIKAGDNVDHPADHHRVDGVVTAGDPHEVVPAEPDSAGMRERRFDRRQGQHRGPVLIDQIERSRAQRPNLPLIRGSLLQRALSRYVNR